jgi:hypothetical protein
MIQYKLAMNKNGLKIVKITGKDFTGFSIQTNQNLPLTHNNNKPVVPEIIEYIKKHGTTRQQVIFKLFTR